MEPKLSSLIEWFNNEFKPDPLFQRMKTISEDSPWHREQNIATHTEMVFQNYLTTCSDRDAHKSVLGGFATIFHDVGKPVAMRTVWREDRGEYKRFGGHEQISARLWEDWAIRNWTMLLNRFDFTIDDLFRVGILIERHLPWNLNNDNVKRLALTLIHLDIDDVFNSMLLSDVYGRMSDDATEKRKISEEWCSDFGMKLLGWFRHPALYEIDNPSNKPTMYVPIAASGSGKSTLASHSYGIQQFSLDSMRHELYGEDYEVAFMKSTQDTRFRSICNERFMDIIRTNVDVFLDNTNTSKKNRNFYLTEARKRGYFLQALLLPVSLKTIVERQNTRSDKTVPIEAVNRQYFGLSLPSIGEFDNITVFDSNIK